MPTQRPAVLEGACRPAPPELAGSGPLPATADLAALAATARRIRRHAVGMVAIAGMGYLGQATSSAELFAVLYRAVLRHGRDRFVLSPGHYAITHYAAAVEAGLLAQGALATYGVDGTWLESISTERTPLVSATCGALGQGLSVGVGLALAAALAGEDRRTFVFASDGEMEEGQTWEAAMFAAHHGLGGLVLLLDCNGSQVDGPIGTVTTIEPVSAKWRSFGWDVHGVDGHNVGAILAALEAATASVRPSVLVARTVMLEGLGSVGDDRDAHFVTFGPGDVERALADTAPAASAAPAPAAASAAAVAAGAAS